MLGSFVFVLTHQLAPLPEDGLRLDANDDGIPSGLPSPRCPNRELMGKAGCPNMEKAPGRCARWANGIAAAML